MYNGDYNTLRISFRLDGNTVTIRRLSNYLEESTSSGLVLLRVCADVLQGADDVRGHWGRSGQVLARGMVTVGISRPGSLVQLTLRIVIVGHPVGHDSSQTGLRVRDSVGRLEVVRVSSVVVHFVGLRGDVGIAVDVRGRGGNGQDGGDGELKNEN